MSVVRSTVAFLVLLGATGCSSTNIDVNRGYDREFEEEMVEAASPDAFADRLGEPDEWKHDGTGNDVRMTAIWKCLEGEYREVTWRMYQREAGGQAWKVVSDETRPGECD